MPRDVHNFDATQTKRRIRNGSLSGTFTTTRKAKRSTRSDSVPTLPLPDGSFGTSTNYSAFFATTTAIPGSCIWRDHSWPYNGVWVTYQDVWDGWTDRGTWNHGVDAALEPAIPAVLLNRVRNAAIEKIRDTDLNMGQFIGELRQTTRTVTSILEDIARPLRALRRLTTAGAFAREYLRYIYGVKPLIADVYSLCEQINKRFAFPLGIAKVSMLDETYAPPTFTGLSYSRTCEGTFVRGVEIAYRFTATDPDLFQLWRFGLTNPASIAWELLTLSFVVDWFTGLGNFFAALDTSIAVKILDGYETRFLRNNFDLVEQQHPNAVANRIVVTKPDPARTTVTTKAMRRYSLSAVAVPLPYLDARLNLNQLMSAIALITARGR